MPGGAGAVAHFAERGVARQGAQQGGLAGIGVSNYGNLYWRIHFLIHGLVMA
jgi:hypothetical protein